MDAWDYLRQGDSQLAIDITKAEFDKTCRDASLAIQLTAFYLWLKDWDGAYEHIYRYIEANPNTMEFAFVLSGTAKWCSGDREAAVAEWRQGIDVDYADTAGGIAIPLHLFFASVSQPDLVPKAEAAGLLGDRLNGRRGHRWPGHLGRLVLGEMTDKEVYLAGAANVEHLRDESLRQAMECFKLEVDVWKGVKLLAEGKTEGFLNAIKSTSDLTWADFDECRHLFIDRCRSSECHLARCEVGKD